MFYKVHLLRRMGKCNGGANERVSRSRAFARRETETNMFSFSSLLSLPQCVLLFPASPSLSSFFLFFLSSDAESHAIETRRRV